MSTRIAESQTTASESVVDYGMRLEKELRNLQVLIAEYPAVAGRYRPRWLAIKILEDDAAAQERVLQLPGGPALITKAQLRLTKLKTEFGEDLDILIADRRYSTIHKLVGEVVQKPPDELTVTDRIDRLVTHPILGVPIFLVVMWVTFKITADVSAPLLDWVDGVISGPVTRWAAALFDLLSLGESWIAGLVIDGIISGVGGVLVFVPVLMSLYITLAILEDTGYMARAAFVMDGVMSRIGLQGKSFLPMMVGFGCSVPAIYATRTLENEKDRILTALLVPFMSCGARLPVYVLFAAVFFPTSAGLVVFSMYLLGIITAMMLGMILRRTLFRDKKQTVLLMELPPYRLPNWKTIWSHTWERTSSFIKNAWTLILVTSVILWFLIAIPVGSDAGSFADTDVDRSLFATVSGAISPLLRPLGFGSWESTGALLTGFVAKEVVVSTIAQVYGVADEVEETSTMTLPEEVVDMGRGFVWALFDTVRALPGIVGIDLGDEDSGAVSSTLRQAVSDGFTTASNGHGALAGLAFMVFVLIYTPCVVAIAAERQELGTQWMWRSIFGQLALAWLMAFAVYQGGLLLGLG